ncbi:MAG: hypothetical protein QM800_15235 [Paludibacter sp.]
MQLILKGEVPIIYSSNTGMNKYDLPAKMKYPFWFEIVKVDSINNILSTYKITPNDLGRKLLKSYGIPEAFPAVLEHDEADYKFLYFAGDFCDNPIGLKSAKYKWIDKFSSFAYKKSPEERVSFFWNFYRPMIDKILLKYSLNRN